MRKATLCWLLVMLAVLGLGSGSRAAPVPTTIEVGENAACDYHTIAAAISGANPGDTIKVQHKVFVEPPLVVAKSLHFIGGYGKALYGEEACLTNTGTGRATVHPEPGSTGPLFQVQGATVRVEWFVFEQGAYDGVAVYGGGVLSLENSIVQDNGDGGLTVLGATASLLETEILGNDRTLGGGIFMDSGANVTASASLIKDNEGWDQGAGVYLTGASAFQALEGTRIELNVTPPGGNYGGGIAAIGAGTEVMIDASHVLTNTAISRGGGLYLAGGAQAWIKNGSWLQGNQTFGPGVGGGGAVHVTGTGSYLHLKNAIVHYNWSDPAGGAIYTDDGGAIEIRSTWLVENTGRENGGAVYNDGGTVTCKNSFFWGNRVLDYDGGAIASIGPAGALDVEQCFFVDNTTDSGNGGAIYVKHPFASVRRSYFTANKAPLEGSAIFLSGMDVPLPRQADVVNNYFVDNPTLVTALDGAATAPAGTAGPEGPYVDGSSLYTEYNTAYLLHNTFAHQSLASQHGVLANGEARVKMVNNILTNFSVGIGRDTTGTGAVDAYNTLFFGNSLNYVPSVAGSDEILGNPLFVGGGNYNLTAASPAINAGTDAGVTFDYYGGHRPWGGGFEIGAEEYPRQKHVYMPMVAK